MMEKNYQSDIKSEYDQNFAFHPWNVMLFLTILGISALFLALSAAFVYTRIEHGVSAIRLPWLFVFNTLILLGSSWTMWKSKNAYKTDDTKAYQLSLKWTIWLSLFFLVMQFIAWGQLFSQDIFLDPGNNAVNYLYLLSALHFAHVIAGLPFLFLFLRAAKKQMKEPVTVLVYFSDPEKRLKLRLLSIYWHFLDGLWIFLVLFLFVNYLVR